MKAPRFGYVRPQNLDHALQLLAEHGDEARILAGGQSLMPVLNMRLAHPRLLIDINGIEPLKGISLHNGTVRIGALARHVEVIESAIIARHLPLIAEAMPQVAHVAVRNRGTLGGSIALADPAAELPACVLALQASIVLQSTRGRRTVPAGDFFHGLYETAREPDELVVEVLLPEQRRDCASVLMELSRRHGDFAIAGLACSIRVDQETLREARLVYFGSEVKPTVARHAMAAVEGKPWSSAVSEAACAALADDLDPIDNIFGRPATKLHLQRVLTKRALAEAMERARAR